MREPTAPSQIGPSQIGASRTARRDGAPRLDGYRPGALGRVVELHARYYGRHWGFGLYFEVKVASELAAFLSRQDPARDRFWVALADEEIVGSITIDGSGAENGGAHLRWFIVAPSWQGRGIGRLLLTDALTFARGAGFDRLWLWTFAGLETARHLYEANGFRLLREVPDAQWGPAVTGQLFEARL